MHIHTHTYTDVWILGEILISSPLRHSLLKSSRMHARAHGRAAVRQQLLHFYRISRSRGVGCMGAGFKALGSITKHPSNYNLLTLHQQLKRQTLNQCLLGTSLADFSDLLWMEL